MYNIYLFIPHGSIQILSAGKRVFLFCVKVEGTCVVTLSDWWNSVKKEIQVDVKPNLINIVWMILYGI